MDLQQPSSVDLFGMSVIFIFNGMKSDSGLLTSEYLKRIYQQRLVVDTIDLNDSKLMAVD
jgi:hypothetical protein